MTHGFLLDTNVLSEPLKPSPDRGLISLLEENAYLCSVPAPGWHELVRGTELLPSSRKRRRIEQYLYGIVRDSFPCLPYDQRAAEVHAGERVRLRKLGKPAPFIDGQIAAIALVHGLTLVTANVRDFERYSGLETVNWLDC